MDFVFLNEPNLNLKIELNSLKRDSQRYKILMYQHEGEISITSQSIGNRKAPTVEFDEFFKMAKQKDKEPDLVLTPEYSCPWKAIESIISENQKWPSPRKLWVIGMESLSKEVLRSFVAKFNDENKLIIYDNSVFTENKNFLDPVLYLFMVEQDGVQKLLILIQFKTRHMGVWGGDRTEHNHLIQGKIIYVIQNSTFPTVSFMTLICSEAMNFKDSLNIATLQKLDWEDKPFIIYNPQCNPKPQHPDFTAFRKFIFEGNDKELISLNWHQDSIIAGKLVFTESSPRSGFALKSTEVNLKDKNRIKKNHQLGLYYFNLGKNRHGFLLNGGLHVFFVDLPAIKISGVLPVQMVRDGPEMDSIYQWDSGTGVFAKSINGISDNHIAFISGLGCVSTFLLHNDTCILEKEMLVCLSAGRFMSSIDNNWFHLDQLYSFFMDDIAEIARRISYVEERVPSCVEKITTYIEAINELNANILNNDDRLPESIRDLRGQGISLGYYPDAENDRYRYNVVGKTGKKAIATILYLGLIPEKKAGQLYSLLWNLFDFNNRGRIVIYYKVGVELKWHFAIDAGGITNDNEIGPDSFRKQSQVNYE